MSKNLPSTRSASKALATLTPLQRYLQEIAKYPLLSPEEEYAAAKDHFDKGDVAAAHRLVTSNLRLVVKIANDFRQAQATLLDLIQEGNYGLMQAVKKFNPYKGVKLSSYAAWWIKAYILKYIMDNRSQVKIGTTAAQRKLFYNLKKATEKLLEEYEQIDVKMLADTLDVKEKDVVEMQMRLAANDLSLDAPINPDGDPNSPTQQSIIAAPQVSVEEELARSQIREIFGAHLADFEKSLQGRDLFVFRERMLNEQPMTLQEIGEKFGITRERARQIEARIFKKLKDFVEKRGQLIELTH
ncbi:MAG: RNA polymerase factor sigma-32 [Oligoflexales bacterium]